MKLEYITIFRPRTNESIVCHLNSSLSVIKNYHNQQQFMSKLGQENYWKKNRLTLWRDLKALATTAKVDSAFKVEFVNSINMLRTIKWRLTDHYNKVFQDREFQDNDIVSYRDCNYWSQSARASNHYSSKHRRVFRADFKAWQVEHSRRAEFEADIQALYKKYHKEDLDQEFAGKQHFDTHQLAIRFVSMFYRIKDSE